MKKPQPKYGWNESVAFAHYIEQRETKRKRLKYSDDAADVKVMKDGSRCGPTIEALDNYTPDEYPSINFQELYASGGYEEIQAISNKLNDLRYKWRLRQTVAGLREYLVVEQPTMRTWDLPDYTKRDAWGLPLCRRPHVADASRVPEEHFALGF